MINEYFKSAQRTLRGPHGILFHPEGHIIVRGRLSEGGCQRDAVRGRLSEEFQMWGKWGGMRGISTTTPAAMREIYYNMDP